MAVVAERWPVRFNFVFQTDRVEHSAPIPDQLYSCSSQQAAWVDQVSRANADAPVVLAGRILETLARDQAGSDPTS